MSTSCLAIHSYPWVWQYSWFLHFFSNRPSSFCVSQRSTSSLTGPRTPCGRWITPFWPLPLSLPLPRPSTRPLGPSWSRSRRGTYRFFFASTRLAVSDTISAWAMDSSNESDVDGVLFVLIVPGMDLSLLLASSFTLSTTLLMVVCCWSVYRLSWLTFNTMSLYSFCSMTLFACSSFPCSSFNRCFLWAALMKDQNRATVRIPCGLRRHYRTDLLMELDFSITRRHVTM